VQSIETFLFSEGAARIFLFSTDRSTGLWELWKVEQRLFTVCPRDLVQLAPNVRNRNALRVSAKRGLPLNDAAPFA